MRKVVYVRPRTLTRRGLAAAVNAIYGLRPRSALGTLLVTLILDSMVRALQRGETVSIPGFGRWIPRRRTQRQIRPSFQLVTRVGARDYFRRLETPNVYTLTPVRVWFKPAPDLRRRLKQDLTHGDPIRPATASSDGP